jgi:FixJ family two-component response regulator
MKTGDPIVFVVDDDSSMREALTDLFTSIGLLVEAFKSAPEFLEHRRPDASACLVLDVRLPGLSGLDLQRELVRTEASIPIIFITGHGDIPMAVRAIKEGAVDFLTKPFRDQDLLDAIQHALEIDRAVRQERVVVAEVRRRYESLTKREREVMRLVVSGLLNKQKPADSMVCRCENLTLLQPFLFLKDLVWVIAYQGMISPLMMVLVLGAMTLDAIARGERTDRWHSIDSLSSCLSLLLHVACIDAPF